MNKPLTLGERRVRVNFNVSGDTRIDVIKKIGAEAINLINAQSVRPQKEDESAEDYSFVCQEFGRLKSIAMTEYESATSWAVKAVTS